jgi:hypothetical protein
LQTPCAGAIVPVQVHGTDADPIFVGEGDIDAARRTSQRRGTVPLPPATSTTLPTARFRPRRRRHCALDLADAPPCPRIPDSDEGTYGAEPEWDILRPIQRAVSATTATRLFGRSQAGHEAGSRSVTRAGLPPVRIAAAMGGNVDLTSSSAAIQIWAICADSRRVACPGRLASAAPQCWKLSSGWRADPGPGRAEHRDQRVRHTDPAG